MKHYYKKLAINQPTPKTELQGPSINWKLIITIQPSSFLLRSKVILKNATNAGLDHIFNIRLKHLGLHEINGTTEIFNYSLTRTCIPSIWEKALILPNLNPNKNPSHPSLCRIISLLCTLFKVMEKILFPHVEYHIYSSLPFPILI